MWKVVGASVPGTLHVASGRPCEDASGWFTADELTCLVAADGAGSRPLSGQGSALAVQSALTAAVLDGGPGQGHPIALMRAILTSVRTALGEHASAQGRDLGDYATTLAVVLLTEEAACAGQIGDTIVVAHHDGGYQTVAPAPRGEYVNETAFVTDALGVAEARITLLPATLDAVFLATDGLRFKILDDLAATAPFPPFFDDLAAYLRSPGASRTAIGKFLSGLTDDQTGDDKTLVAAVRDPGVRLAGAPAASSATVKKVGQ
jgi:hypothetical protein